MLARNSQHNLKKVEAIEVTEMKKNSDNREYVIKQVAKQGKLLEFADCKLQDDEEVVRWRSNGICVRQIER